ncbi:MAG: sulfotransferase family protein [Acidimicrobiales bacterium]|nr:hypothetical protein [Hyphomonadaceae bacterium]RZV44293.1 MAG: sulfotransferase family protein [Acidimicrobiales bacterium]
MNSTQREDHIDRALVALNEGRANDVLSLCQAVLEANMNDAEAWSIYGLAGLQFEPDKAVQALQRAIQLEPQEPRWRIHLGVGLGKIQRDVEAEQVLLDSVELTNGADEALIPWSNSLLKLGKLDQATTALRDAANKNGSSALWMHLSNILSANDDLIGSVAAREKAYSGHEMPIPEKLSIANQHVLLGQYDQSQKYVDDLLAYDNNEPETIFLAANLKRWRGELDDAHEFLSSAVQKNSGDPRLLLALLDLNRVEDNGKLDAAKTFAENASLPIPMRRGLAFVVARRADKSGNYDEAWQFSLKANGLYDDGAVSQIDLYRKQIEMGLNMFPQIEEQKSENDQEHIYVIGPPRSGGSLLQTIIAAAPDTFSVGERGALMAWLLPLLEQSSSNDQALAEFNRIAADLQKADTAGIVRSLGHEDAKIFVDKMPHHSHVAGLIAKIHPKSKFVDVRRNAHDMATSILFHDFTDKFGYSRSISDIADYLVFQREAIQSWQKAGMEILIHDHNQFLDAPEVNGEKLFQSLELPWQASYLDPEKRKSTVRTFSALQVRSKVTKAYSGRGERYREFMGEVAGILDELNAIE